MPGFRISLPLFTLACVAGAELGQELAREVGRLMQEQYLMMQSLSEEVRDVERQFADYVVTPMIESLKRTYQDHERVTQHLDHVHDHILDNLSNFREGGAPQAIPALAMGATYSQWPVPWLGSTITGRWVSFLRTGTALRSRVKRVAVSKVRMPRSQSTTL